MKGGRNQEGYADPTATIAVGRVAKEEREQVECEVADKRAYEDRKSTRLNSSHPSSSRMPSSA